jgi:hypothetical protein
MKLAGAIGVVLGLALAAAPAGAFTFFQTPARNVHCVYNPPSSGVQASIRCDVDFRTRFRRPSNCDLEFGDAFEISRRGRGHAICHGDTTKLPGAARLSTGVVRRFGALRCRAPSRTSIRCWNPGDHGFFLSPSRQLVY